MPHANRNMIGRLATLHAVAMGLCTGVVVATGVAAAIAFPTMRDLNPTLPSLEGLDDQWMLVAGQVMARVFSATAVVELLCLTIAAIAFVSEIALSPRPRRGRSLAVRSVALLALVIVYAHNLGVLQPRMNTNFQNIFTSAEQGDLAGAKSARAAFGADHPAASRELGAIAALSLVGALMSGWSIGHKDDRETCDPASAH